MKKLTAISIITASLIVSGCWNETKDVAKETTTQATQSIQETTSKVADSAKQTGSEVAQKATKDVKKTPSQAAKNTKQATTDAPKSAKSATQNTSPSAVVAATAEPTKDNQADIAKGKALYAKCAGCHGNDGKTKALGKSASIAAKSASEIEAMLREYKAGTRNVAGMGMLMKGQVAALSDDDLKALSAYIATFK